MTEAPAAVPSSGRLLRAPVLIACLALAVSLTLTFFTWKLAQERRDAAFRNDFSARTALAVKRIANRMDSYSQAVRSTQSFVLGTVDVQPDDFRLFAETLRLRETFPGIQALALVRSVGPTRLANPPDAGVAEAGRIPEPGADARGNAVSAIIQIQPLDAVNARAIGFDMLTDPVRREAMERARDTGELAATGPVILVQDQNAAAQPGIVLYAPVYARGSMPANVEERRARLVGWTGAPFRMHDVMQGLRIEASDELLLDIHAGAAADESNVLYRSAGFPPESTASSEVRAPSKGATVEHFRFGGRQWTVQMRSTAAYDARLNDGKAKVIAYLGVAISVLLPLLLLTFAWSRTRAVSLAFEMTQQLRESNARVSAEQRRIQLMLENTHDGFVALDERGCVTDWNAKAQSIFGWTFDEIVGKDFADVVIPEHLRAAHRHGLAQFIKDGIPRITKSVVEVEGLHKEGRLIPLELAIAGASQESGMVMSAFIRDVTQQKEAARLDAHRKRQLEDIQAELEHSRRLEAVGTLTGGIAHDFNNVLQIVGGNVQILERVGAGNTRLEARLASITRAVDRGAKLASDLLAFARKKPLRPVVVNLGRMAAELEDALKRSLGEVAVLEVSVARNVWNVLVDVDELHNVILNLALNARDSLKQDGPLRVAIANSGDASTVRDGSASAVEGENVLIQVSDTGGGMPPDVLARAFEPFFTTKPAGEGTGLGLSMAYGFVKQSGGHIEIESQEGEGTTVSIYLPRSLEEESDQGPRHDPDVLGGNESVLVVEDDAGVQGTVVTLLEDLGYRVVTAHNGSEALQQVQGGLRPDVLFTDVVMPGPVSSTAMAEKVAHLVPGIAVVFTSGYTRAALIKDGRLQEGVQLLNKPYKRSELARLLRRVIDGRNAGSAQTSFATAPRPEPGMVTVSNTTEPP